MTTTTTTTTTQPQHEFLISSEVADLLRVSAETLRRQVREGRGPLPAARAGRQLLWRREDVEAWLAEHPPLPPRPRGRRCYAEL